MWWHQQASPLGSDSEQAGEHSSVEPRVGSPLHGGWGKSRGEPRLGAVSQLSGEQVDLEEPLEPSGHIQGQDGRVGWTRTGKKW